MGLELIPAKQRRFKGEDVEAIKEEDEGLSEEEKENLLEYRRLNEFWSNLQPFLDGIESYEPTNKMQGLDIQEGKSEKDLREREKEIADKKEKERVIDLPYIAEKITIGYLYSLLKKEKIQESVKDFLKLDKNNSLVEICLPTAWADWFAGADGYLIIRKKEGNQDKIIKEIPIQITTASNQEIKQKKLKTTDGILLILNKEAFSELIDKYLVYLKQLDSKIKTDKEKLKEEIKEGKIKAPWDLFEVYDVKEKDKIIPEGISIKEQLINNLKFLKI